MNTANWKEENNKLYRSFEFKDFIAAFAFLSKVAILAEKQNHHPEIFNVYNQVTIKLNTHDAGNIVTAKDHQLANAINEIV